MTPADLMREVGETLFGSRWRAELCQALFVSERTMRRWINGTVDVPSGAWIDIRRLLTERSLAIAKIDARIADYAASARVASDRSDAGPQ